MKRLLILSGILATCIGTWAQQINRVEYFWDVDPGFGNGTALSIATVDSINSTFSIPTTSLSPGLHTLYVRARNTDGAWSVFSKQMVHIQSPVFPVVAAEYFFDTDPGLGNGTPLTITPGDSVDGVQNISTIGLQPGMHTLYVRVKTAPGHWSVYSKALVHIQSPDSGPIVAAEYFIDTDPGFGNGTPIPITAGDSIDLTVPVNTTSLSPGIHTVYIRVKNANGAWSVFSKNWFHVQHSEPQQIVAAEYFVDTDPGFGNATPIPITPGDSVWANFQVPTHSLSPGLHMIYVRVKDGDGKWSVYSKSMIYIDHPNDAQIVQAEYFVDNDPGIGNATPITITPGDSITAAFQIPTNTLLIGSHTAYVRVKDSYGRWSVYSKDTFYVGNFNCLIYGNGLIEITGDTCRGSQLIFTDRVASQSGVLSDDYIREWDFFNDGSIDFSPDSVVQYTFNTPGTYTVKLTTKEIANPYCQETVLKTFTIRNIDSTTVNVSICQGQSYFAGGGNQTTSGTYYDTFDNRYGCDSVVTTHLTVVPNVTPSVSLSASQTSFCSGTSVLFTATPTNGGTLPYYKWYVNGNLVFQGGGIGYSTYGTSSLQNNDIVTVEMTSSETCTTTNPVVSNPIQVSVTPSVSASITIAADTNNFCYGTTATFSVVSVVNEGSNPQYAWYRNNVLVQTGGTSYVASDLTNGESVRCMLTSDANCVNNSPVSSNTIYMTVYAVGDPFVAIQPDANNICYGTPVTFYTVSLYQGSNPEYRWFLNGTLVQAGSASTYTNNTLNDGDSISCVLVSDYQCRTDDTDTSNSVIMNVIYNVPVTVSLAYSDNDICDGQTVSFTATPNPFFGGETYTWYKNGQVVQSGSSRFYTDNTLVDEDSVWVVLEASPLPCASGLPVSSDTVHFNVTLNVTVNVSLEVTDDEICEGTNITFTARPTNPGNSPLYYWYINNTYQPGLGNLNTFSSSALGNGDQVMVVLLSSIECALNNPATSNTITMTVYDTLMPSASISASQTTICAGTLVNFDLVIANEGSNPLIEWLVNGNLVQTGGLSYSSSSLQDLDQIQVRLTSGYVCPITNPVWSNVVTMTVFQYVTPTVLLSVAPNPACPGDLISLVATPFNGGTQPVFTFYKNDTIIHSGQQNTYTSSNFAEGDVVYVIMQSNLLCLNTPVDTSNVDTIRIHPSLSAGVSIEASTAQCVGNPITFRATPVNGGSNPEYRWKVNNVLFQQGPSDTFTVSGLNNGDVVVCEMLSSLSCATNNPATSNAITIQYNSFVTPSVDLTASDNDVCEGTWITFTATPTNGGNNPSYVWRVNTTIVQSGPSNTFSTTLLQNSDVVSVEMTSSEPCVNVNPVNDQITMIINQCGVVSVSLQATSSACEGDDIVLTAIGINEGTNPNYEFFINGVSVQNGASNTYTIANAQSGTYEAYVVLTSSLQYVTNNPATSNVVEIEVNDIVTPTISLTPNQDGTCQTLPVTFTTSVTNAGNNPVYTWYINGIWVQNYHQPQLTDYFGINDTVTVVLTSSEACAQPNTVSDGYRLDLIRAANPTVSLQVSSYNYCPGSPITFTALPDDAGANPSYNFYVNGLPVQSSYSHVFISSTLQTGDVVVVEMNADGNCLNNILAYDTFTVQLAQCVPVDVILQATALSGCDGDDIVFTAVPTNEGTNPNYEFFVNGVSVQNGGASSYTLTNATPGTYNVHVVLTSSLVYTTNNPATSNLVSVVIHEISPVSVTISSDTNDVCENTLITFTAEVTNGGSNPVYTWYVNNNAVLFYNQPVFSGYFNNADEVYVTVYSNAICPDPNPAVSNTIMLNFYQTLPVSITIDVDTNNFCSGTLATFVADATNEGIDPRYDWYVNGSLVQSGGVDIYSSSALNDGDTVWCVLTSSELCTSINPATSNYIHINVLPELEPQVDIVSNYGSASCVNDVVIFTANSLHGGTNPIYEWFVDGISQQVSPSNTFTLNTSTPGIFDVTVQMTSDYLCAINNPATSNVINFEVSGALVPEAIISSTATSICPGQSVSFFASHVNGGLNPVYEWYVNNTYYQNGQSFTYSSFNHGDSVYLVLTSSLSCADPSVDTSEVIYINVAQNATASVTITASVTTICSGQSVTFYASAFNAGTAPTYNWYLNGLLTQSGSIDYFTTNTLQDGDSVWVEMISNDPCVAVTTVYSNIMVISVGNLGQASVTINASATTICRGQMVTFTATPINGGTTPLYEWRVNGNSVQSGNSNTFTSNTLQQGDIVYVVMTSNDPCVSNQTAVSNQLVISVGTSQASVSLSASATSVCVGQQVTVTATPVNGGSAPNYQWFVNGLPVFSGPQHTYTVPASAPGTYSVYVIMTSNDSCVVVQTATSNTLNINVIAPQASVSIVANVNNVCPGTPITFTAVPVNEGTAPTYQWFVNGNPVQTGASSTYTSSSLANGDVVQVRMTSNDSCVANPTVNSNTLTVTIVQNRQASVNITASANNVCVGTNVSVIATPVNGGTAPVYQWIVNGNIVQTGNSNTYSAVFNNGDVVQVRMTSNDSCVAVPTVTSNSLTITVIPPSPLNVSIVALPSTSICPGDSVSFTTTSTNAGLNPDYVWTINGTVVSTQSGFTTNQLNDGDTVAVLLISYASCLTSNTATDAVIIRVGGLLTANVSIIAQGGSSICSGDAVTFVATPLNGGTNPQYQWQVNGVNVGGNSAVFTTSALQEGDSVRVIMTSSSNCVANPVTISNTVVMSVTQRLTPSVVISGPDSLCSGDTVTYLASVTHGGSNPSFIWTVNGTIMSQSSVLTYAPEVDDTIRVQVTSNYPCVTNTVATATFYPIVSESPIAMFTTEDSMLAVIFSNYIQENTQYDWYFGDGSNAINVPNPIHIYSRGGNYTVTLIATNACGSDTSVMVVPVSNVGMEDAVISLESLSLYPNPTENRVNIELVLRAPGTVQITWHDAIGREVTSQLWHMSQGNNVVAYDLGQYAKGIYSVCIDAGGLRIFKKVVLY